MPRATGHIIKAECSHWRCTLPKAILFVLCGILNAVIAALYFSHAERGFHFQSSIVLVGEFTIAAGICMLAAGVWNGRINKSWLLAPSGIACTVLGLILTFWR